MAARENQEGAMKTKEDRREEGKKAVVAGLVLAAALFVAATPAEARARRGATVVITTKAGSQISGELIAVKRDSLLILDRSGTDRSLDLTDLRSVKVFRRSKGGVGGLLGLVAGAAGGYLGGFASAAASGACPDCEAPLSGYLFGVIGGVLGLGVGAMIGEAAGGDVVISLQGQPEPSLQTRLRTLRKYARVGSPL
jgi:hypothetical protein